MKIFYVTNPDNLNLVREGDLYNNQGLPQDYEIKETGGLADLVA